MENDHEAVIRTLGEVKTARFSLQDFPYLNLRGQVVGLYSSLAAPLLTECSATRTAWPPDISPIVPTRLDRSGVGSFIQFRKAKLILLVLFKGASRAPGSERRHRRADARLEMPFCL
jgi:hypothetical protein